MPINERERAQGINRSITNLVELSGHVEIVDGWGLATDAIEADERVDLEIGKVEIDIDRVEADEEIDKGILLGFSDMNEDGLLDLVARWELSTDGDGKSECLCVDIANIDTTFVGEKDLVTLTSRIDADVEFSVGRMWKEGLDDECVESTRD